MPDHAGARKRVRRTLVSRRLDTDRLPQNNRSQSNIRTGGRAVLTIDYGADRVTLSGPPPTAAGNSPPAAPLVREEAFER